MQALTMVPVCRALAWQTAVPCYMCLRKQFSHHHKERTIFNADYLNIGFSTATQMLQTYAGRECSSSLEGRAEAQAVSMNILNELGHSLREFAFRYMFSTTVAHTFPEQGCSQRLHWDQKQKYSKDQNFCSSRKKKKVWHTVTAELPLASLRKYDPWQVKLTYATGNNKKWIRKKWRKIHNWRLLSLLGTDSLGSK